MSSRALYRLTLAVGFTEAIVIAVAGEAWALTFGWWGLSGSGFPTPATRGVIAVDAFFASVAAVILLPCLVYLMWRETAPLSADSREDRG